MPAFTPWIQLYEQPGCLQNWPHRPFCRSLLWLAVATATSMFVLKGLFVAVALTVTVLARPTSQIDFEKSIVEVLKEAPPGWNKDASQNVEKDATSITLKIHVVNKNMDEFHEHATNVSTHSCRWPVEPMLMSYTGRDTRSCSIRPTHVSRRDPHYDCPSRRVDRSRYAMARE
jgi:hypothetical protein